MQKLLELVDALDNGIVTTQALVEQSIERIEDNSGEGERAFTALYTEEARSTAAVMDNARINGDRLPTFAGIPISIKDLFDVAGEVTRAGSHVLDENKPAQYDAPIIKRLRQAGFILLGKTNMTEFAYSGLGMNAHYGTPLNPYDRDTGHIPGGSTSGGAVSVADGMAAATIGTDTGGSCRIPAAFCGIVGFKSTTTRIPRDGIVPLSTTLDSIGPLANSVSCCAILDDILAGGDGECVDTFPALGLRLGVLHSYVVDDMDQAVSQAFEAALTRLSLKGVQLIPLPLDELNKLPTINANGGFVGAEAYAWHRPLLEKRGDFYDPWVKARFEAGKTQSAADYIDLLKERKAFVERIRRITHRFDALVMPTVQITPPTISELEDPDVSNATNRLVLRNTAVGNFLDRPCISLPCHQPGGPPVGLMLMADTGEDRRLLSIAKGLEPIVMLDK